jgi:hypothetical protein
MHNDHLALKIGRHQVWLACQRMPGTEDKDDLVLNYFNGFQLFIIFRVGDKTDIVFQVQGVKNNLSV